MKTTAEDDFLTRWNVQQVTWKKKKIIITSTVDLWRELLILFPAGFFLIFLCCFVFILVFIKYFCTYWEAKVQPPSQFRGHGQRTEKERKGERENRPLCLFCILLLFSFCRSLNLFFFFFFFFWDWGDSLLTSSWRNERRRFPPLVLETPEQSRCGVPSPWGGSPSLTRTSDAISSWKSPNLHVVSTKF